MKGAASRVAALYDVHGNEPALDAALGAAAGATPESLPEFIREPIRWAASQLSQSDRDFLAELPATITLEIAGVGRVLFCHATPASDETIFTRETREDRVRQHFQGVSETVVVCGHTHMQFRRVVGHVEIVNAGSVGMPYGSPGAHWLRLGPSIELCQTAYDAAAAARTLRRSAFPDVATFIERSVLNPPPESEMLALFGGR